MQVLAKSDECDQCGGGKFEAFGIFDNTKVVERCNHVFHKSCLDTARLAIDNRINSDSCPICGKSPSGGKERVIAVKISSFVEARFKKNNSGNDRSLVGLVGRVKKLS